MTDEQLRVTWQIYDRVSELPPDERVAYIQAASADPMVVAEVLQLLEESNPRAESGPEEQTPGRIGSSVGPYLITGLLGRGGMGEVYSARDTTLGRVVALKLLPAGSTNVAVQRHIREAKAASSLSHPNIVSIYQVVDTRSDVAIAMELVEGNSFRRLAGQSLPVEHICRFGAQAAQALAAAHRQGIIHRDIKPENLMVRPDGFVKVLDFGLARELTGNSSTGLSVPLGTLRYMSPEQTRAEPVTGATDIFSLGLVLYELATGCHPFAANSALEVAHAIGSATPAPPSTLNHFVPEVLDRLVMSMLAKSPADRPDAAQVAEALEKVGRGARAVDRKPAAIVSGAPPQKRSPKAWIWSAGALGIVAVATGLVWALWPTQQEPEPLPLKTESDLVSATGPDDPIPPRHIYGILPDGNLLIYVDDSGDEGGGLRWIASGMSAPSSSANFAQFDRVLAGGDGVIYGIAKDGTVTYFRLVDPWRNEGTLRWGADSNRIIGKINGDFPQLAALSRPVWIGSNGDLVSYTGNARGGTIWGLTPDGRTSLFQHGWTGKGEAFALVDTTNWATSPPNAGIAPQLRGPELPPNEDCDGCKLLDGGNGITYAVTSKGKLLRFRRRAGDGDWVKATGKSARTEHGTEIGYGWLMFKTVFAAPGEYKIEGYVSTRASGNRPSTSAEPGEVVKVRASTFSPVYRARLLRLQRCTWDDAGTANGLIDGLPVGESVKVEAPPGGNFKKPQRIGMHLTGADWPGDGADLRLPRNAPSGIYAAELTTPSGGRYLAPFIVRPPSKRHAKIAVVANTITWNAYNQWGGGSRFASSQPATPGATYELSFDRPLEENPVFGGASASPGLTDRAKRGFNQLVRAEVWVTSVLDGFASIDRNYTSDVYSDLDLDGGIPKLSQYKALILQTMPEFWTESMRENLERYIAAGGHVIYLGSRGISDRVSLSRDGRLEFRNGPGSGCLTHSIGPRTAPQGTCPAQDLFRWPDAAHAAGQSERAILGVAQEPYKGPVDFTTQRFFVVAAPHPFLSRSGLEVGSRFGAMPGLNSNLPAVDGQSNSFHPPSQCPELPSGHCGATHNTLTGTLLAFSDPNSGSAPVTDSSVVFRKTDNGWVFSIGSVSVGGVLAVDPTLQRILRNALDSALSGKPPQ